MYIKELIKAQMKLERQHAKQHNSSLVRMFIKDFDDQVVKAVNDLRAYIAGFNQYEYTIKSGETRTRHDLKEVHQSLMDKDLSDLMYRILTLVVHKQSITLQQAAGTVVGCFSDIEDWSRKLKAVNLILEYIPLCEIEIIKGAERGYLHSLIELNQSELDALNQQGVVLPSIAPLKKVRSNSDIGYRTFKKSVVMGGKHHDFDMCLPHINKRNAVRFVLDTEIAGRVMAEDLGAFNPEPKFNKKSGRIENANEVQERKEAHIQLHMDLNQKMKALGNHSFSFSHRRDNRGRTYCEAYHLTYQGVDWQKAVISLEKQEYVEPDF